MGLEVWDEKNCVGSILYGWIGVLRQGLLSNGYDTLICFVNERLA